MSAVAEIALKAMNDLEAQRSADREERERLRKIEDAEKDDAVMRDVVDRSPLVEWFPGVEWVLVDRRFPQPSAVVHPVDDPGLLLRVTLTTYADVNPPKFIVDLVVHVSKSACPWRDERRIYSPADLGMAIADRQRAAQSQEVSGE